MLERDGIVFSCNNLNHKIFKEEKFYSPADFHSYLLNPDSFEGKNVAKYQAISSIFNFYSEMRKKAEDEYEDNYLPTALSKKKDIPLDIRSFYHYLKKENNNLEPPITLIVEIAENNYETIKSIGENLNKVLRRERTMVNVDRAQQIDNQCIRWIAKQPGRTPIQKAGPKQQIKAIIRQENFNTLENRIFKHFLKLCIMNAAPYIKEYAPLFQDSIYIKNVRRLLSLCKTLLQMPSLKDVQKVHNIPQPNYVLQNNPKYRTIWECYLQLIKKQKIIERLWSNRHIVYREFIVHAFISIVNERRSKEAKPLVQNYFWIMKFPDDEGRFFNLESEGYYGVFETFSCTITEVTKDKYPGRVQFYSSNRRDPTGIGIIYVPDSEAELILEDTNQNMRNVIICEKDTKISNIKEKSIIINLEEFSSDLPRMIFRKIEESIA